MPYFRNWALATHLNDARQSKQELGIELQDEMIAKRVIALALAGDDGRVVSEPNSKGRFRGPTVLLRGTRCAAGQDGGRRPC